MTTGEAWLIAIVGGALAAVIAALMLRLMSKTMSQKVWHKTLSWLRKPFRIRITNLDRIAQNDARIAKLQLQLDSANRAVVAERDARRVEVEREHNLARAHVAAAEAKAASELTALRALAESEAQEERRIADGQFQLALASGRQDGRAGALADVAAQRAAMVIRPIWRVVPMDAGFLLNNTQSGVTVTDVSISAELGDFEFVGDSQWPGPFDGARLFNGERKRRGKAFGVKFTVQYRDENGDWQTGEAWIDKEPLRALVG